MSNRRKFIAQLSWGSATFLLKNASAQVVMVNETDPLPSSMGYKENSNKVDGTKYPKHATSQQCSNCTLYQGKTENITGGCALFSGKQVTSVGWCNAWSKKL
ncbi:high-potential iron-sulfur protein [Undibacterium sp. RTI2.1]|uniref:high-potential iron-sulfur protein n=1 Tax=unclassified Undibacterium TaxID=2630295 RepID=UPI002AB3BE82|nr:MULTISPECIES: high-potential iron-sulfur protein [unclassified Undibacterium]MDY7539930.1 high-potential iron-sulfur protein [Undibacterium sp. 5I1]MEB0031159.1 high-potential iron-sulfur protein [Undibacterium sp. RTI2.1]MEB0116441.1 high-potential iron-sulfur protein [Undibacterium sp. RTI2.2]MEB0230537.1 high-potential iron-sulfur protein [Undibacterium sp. 10I3]MEB0257235.1 high-potential iron-sulfur protein [Undibacterium sp. 5I1]